MNNAQTLGLIRHILTLLGGFLVAVGWISEDLMGQLTEAILGIAGGVMAIIGIIWSIRSKMATKKSF